MIAYGEEGSKISKNLKDREELYDAIEHDKNLWLNERENALRHILHFIKYYCWTHEPRPKMLEAYGFKHPRLPFMLYPYQEEFVLDLVESINKGEDVLVEKSRDMGVTWLVVTVLLWFFLQDTAGNDFLLGSRKLEFVDKRGSQDTLFEKFRYNLNECYFKPDGYNPNFNDNVNLITNPATGSFIRGESNNANFGTSGRYKASLMDEFSKWLETDADAWTSMGDSTPCRIPVSTPWGIGRKFAQLRLSGAVKVLTLHWSDHPIKGAGKYKGQHPFDPEKTDVWLSPWYLAECERRKDDPDVNIGQELDIDYLSSGTPYFNNMIIQKRYIGLAQNPPNVKRYNYERTGKDDITVSEHANGQIKIFNEPEIGFYNRYIISCDVAEGLEKGDNSSFYVFDRVKYMDVAWYAGKIDTTVLALLLAYFGYWYDTAYIGVERNNHGHAVNQDLKRLEYPNLYHMERFEQEVDYETFRPGWETNMSTRSILCSTLRDAVHEGADGIKDLEFFNEALTFIYNKNGKPEADQGCLDDRVLAQGIKFMVHNWMPATKKEEQPDRHAGKKSFGMDIREKKDGRKFW